VGTAHRRDVDETIPANYHDESFTSVRFIHSVPVGDAHL
jgi:hypothetical protein